MHKIKDKHSNLHPSTHDAQSMHNVVRSIGHIRIKEREVTALLQKKLYVACAIRQKECAEKLKGLERFKCCDEMAMRLKVKKRMTALRTV